MPISYKSIYSLAGKDVTPERIYLNRRSFLGMTLAGVAGLSIPATMAGDKHRQLQPLPFKPDKRAEDVLSGLRRELTPESAVTGYNNFYEFGVDKRDPSANAWRLQPQPWSVQVDGLCEKPGTYGLEDIVDFNRLEERIYRFRCVEGWSMVIPWLGLGLGQILNQFGPGPGARFVRFETLADREQMPGLRWPVLDWPYVEGLRMDEAMHPLSFIAVGLYGKELPNQNGAPLRLVVPWKYGFKSIKSIVRISFTDTQPLTSWEKATPSEYGFYANVNPAVDHPRWSQANERRIGEFGRRKTLLFNGYADEVASLYTGMDLKRFF